MKTRKEILESLAENPKVSVLIIGAGVNGIGTFRDLALQGVDVLMVDRKDYCSGASSASSHMVHGGIRYLENGEFRLVREAVQERNRLIRNAPHYVHPLPTTFPIFRWFSGLLNAPLKFLGLLDRPSERGALVIKIGMALYDAYSGRRRTVPKHTFRSRRKSLEMFPHLNPEVIFTATYYDGAMPTPERICMDLIWDAEEASDQAWAVNYMPAIGAQRDSVQLRDEIGGKVYSVEPEVVINAAGPWIDFVNHDLGRTSNFIGGTKGSHLVLNHPELREAIHDHEFFFENKDGRIVLIFPLLDKILIGTSDIRIEDPDEARCTEEEIDYFFEMIARVFPDIHVDRSHIVYRFSGVRPLPTEKRGLTGQISRDHSIEILDTKDVLGFPILSLVGGKWTSFRAYSEQVSEAVLEILNQSRRVSTKDLAIGGGKGFPQDEETKSKWLHATAEKTGLTDGRLDTLLKRYGTRAEEIATFITQGEDQPLKHHPEFSRREVLFIAQRERVLHLEDFALRRSNLVKLGQLSPGLARELGEILGPMLGWSQGMKDREISRALEVTEFPS